ncbi:MAG: hypothetical protein N2111_14250 [Candidatus Sumerlaeaceae bacterium]|nr:hypothetical protein [Candidatus Sumerlaeaceae bacterium]
MNRRITRWTVSLLVSLLVWGRGSAGYAQEPTDAVSRPVLVLAPTQTGFDAVSRSLLTLAPVPAASFDAVSRAMLVLAPVPSASFDAVSRGALVLAPVSAVSFDAVSRGALVYARMALGDLDAVSRAQLVAGPRPAPFHNLVPRDGAMNRPRVVSLDWEDSQYAWEYDVYVWPALEARPTSPTEAATGVSTWTTGLLSEATWHKWQVVARNQAGEREGAVWRFRTRMESPMFDPIMGDTLTSGSLQPPGSLEGWSSFAFNSALAWPEYSTTAGAYLAYVTPSPDLYRISGVMANYDGWLPYEAVDSNNVVRAKYYMYAGGQPNPADLNQIPNLRMRLSNRFAVNSMVEVFHHTNDNPTQTAMDRELRPSTVATSPSLYRVDFDPLDVPYLAANATVEGITRAFEAYAIYPQDQGFVAMTESVIGVYPSSAVTTAVAPVKVYEPADLALFNPLEMSLINLIPRKGEGEFGVPDPLTSPPVYSETTGGITLDAANVPTSRIGLGVREFNPDRNTNNYPSRVRVEEGKQYIIRWHLTSTQQVNQQAQIRLRARSAKFAWSQKFEVGGAWSTGAIGMYPLNENNTIAQQSLPGFGTLNPDRESGDLSGGWYSMVFHTPLSADIRPEFPPGTPISTRMPNLAGQPGPGVNAFSRRDVFLGIDLVDTISGGEGRYLEAGNVTVDRVEIRTYTLVPD